MKYKKTITYGLIAILCLSIVMAEKNFKETIKVDREAVIPWSDSNLIECKVGNTCPSYSAHLSYVLKYTMTPDMSRYLKETMKGEIRIERGEDYIIAQFKALPWGNDYDSLVSSCGDVKVTEKIGDKITVYKDSAKLCKGKKTTGEKYSNFRMGMGAFCVNYGIVDGMGKGFCVE